MLDLSTGHLDKASRAWVYWLAWDPNGGTNAATQDGWFVIVPEQEVLADPEDMTPNALRAVFAFARSLGCRFVLFDADAPEAAELAVYEDSGKLARPAFKAAQGGPA